MTVEKKCSFLRLLIPRRWISPGTLLWAGLIVATTWAVFHLLGWREYTTVLSGGLPAGGHPVLCTALGILYAAAYLGFVLVAPVLLMAAAIFALLLRLGRRKRTERHGLPGASS